MTGRPRRPEVDAAIREATLIELAAVGYADLTVDAVARRAGVGRPTVYRRAESKAALVADAVGSALAAANPTVPDSGDVADDLAVVLGRTVDTVASTFGIAVRELVGPAARDPELATVLDRSLAERRQVLQQLVGRARDQGRLRGDPEVAIDVLLGAIYYPHLVARRAPSRDVVRQVVDLVVAP